MSRLRSTDYVKLKDIIDEKIRNLTQTGTQYDYEFEELTFLSEQMKLLIEELKEKEKQKEESKNKPKEEKIKPKWDCEKCGNLVTISMEKKCNSCGSIGTVKQHVELL